MKKLKFTIFFILIYLIFLESCSQPGYTSEKLTGFEQSLPDELKGLKVYWVSTGDGGGVYVAILDGKVNSTSYMVGKSHTSTILINKQNNNLIEVSQILLENDSLIVCRK